MSDEEFEAIFESDIERQIARKFRTWLSKNLKIKRQAIYPDDDIYREYCLPAFEPWLVHLFMAYTVCENRNNEEVHVDYDESLSKVCDIISEVYRLKVTA